MTMLKNICTPRNIIVMLAALLILSFFVGFYFYQKAAVDPHKQAQQELQSAIAAVGALMVLPTHEQPTLATVSDPEKLKDQTFFANSQKGDQVLIYIQSHKAILYRPSLHKIIEVAPVGAAPAGVNTATSSVR